MDLFDAFALRHSYRGAYLNRPVPPEDLEKIVIAGIQAPSGCNGQTTRFAIVDDPAMLGEISRVIDKSVVRTAPAIIAVISEKRAVYEQMDFEVQDYSAAVQNMLLAITGLGYASVWLDGVLRSDGIAQKIAAILGVPEGQNMTVSVLLPVGVPAETCPQRERLPFAQRAWRNRR